MASSDVQRKLTAIMCADVVGYSRLMGDDHEGTLLTLTESRKVFSSKIKEYKGRVVNAPGDSILAEFGSVVDSVSCAVEIQRELAESNQELPDNRRMDFRIGVNLGDVLVKEGDLYGDGVNIAARLESLADPGGICISGIVYDQVKARLPLHYDFIGKQRVKNIAEPVKTYRVMSKSGAAAHRVVRAKQGVSGIWTKATLAGMVLVLLAVGGFLGWNYYQQRSSKAVLDSLKKEAAFPIPEIPSIAVLPFANMSDDKEQEYFADGMTDDIITDLSQVGGIFVIARNTAFTYKGRNVNVKQVARDLGIRYVLEGSVRRAGGKVRINAQLIDAATDGHLWAERYDGRMDDIFALQDKITEKIVSALAVKLTAGERKLVTRKEMTNPEAYDAFLKGWSHYRRNTSGDFVKAIPFFTQALDQDPQFSRAHAALADVYSRSMSYGWTKNMDLSLGEAWLKARQHLNEAMKNPVPLAHSVASYILRHESQYQAAIEAAGRAIALDASDPVGYRAMASALIRAGIPAQAMEFINKAMRLDPKNSDDYDYLILLGLSQFGMEQYVEAAASLEKATQSQPDSEWGYLWLAATYGQLGRKAEARTALATWNAHREKAGSNMINTLQSVDILIFAEKRDLDRIREGLRVAGMPLGQPAPNAKDLIHQTKEGIAVKGATTIEAKAAKTLFDQGVVFIDVRPDDDWNKGHIPGAMHLYASKAFSRAALSRVVNVNQEVVIHCAGPG